MEIWWGLKMITGLHPGTCLWRVCMFTSTFPHVWHIHIWICIGMYIHIHAEHIFISHYGITMHIFCVSYLLVLYIHLTQIFPLCAMRLCNMCASLFYPCTLYMHSCRSRIHFCSIWKQSRRSSFFTMTIVLFVIENSGFQNLCIPKHQNMRKNRGHFLQKQHC